MNTTATHTARQALQDAQDRLVAARKDGGDTIAAEAEVAEAEVALDGVLDAVDTAPVPTTWSDRFGNVIDVSRPTTSNIGLLPIGYVIPGCGTIEGVSDTAYRTDNGWWSFDAIHGRPDPVEPLVALAEAKS